MNRDADNREAAKIAKTDAKESGGGMSPQMKTDKTRGKNLT
jgi:hypothetical protein